LQTACVSGASALSFDSAFDALDRNTNPRQSRRDQNVADGNQQSNNKREHRPTPQCSIRYVRWSAPRRKSATPFITPIVELRITRLPLLTLSRPSLSSA